MGWSDPITGNDSKGENRNVAETNAANTTSLANYQAQNAGNTVLNSQLGNTQYYGSADQVFGQQQAAANMLQAQANGSAPSAAAIQQGVGQQAANAGLQSAALSQQGAMNPALAARNMLNSQAQAQQGIVASGTAARAQEQAQAQTSYNNILGGMQGQQQQRGNLQYQQQQQMLNQGIGLSNDQYQHAFDSSQAAHGNSMQNYTQQAQAQTAGIQAVGGIAAAAGGGAPAIGAKVANKVVNQ